MSSTWRSYVYQSRSVGLSERPKPAIVGADDAVSALHQRGQHLAVQVGPGRLSVEADDRAAVALVQVVEPQAVHLRVVRLELVTGQPVEALVWCAEDVQGER